MGADFTPLLAPIEGKRPKAAWFGKAGVSPIIRDQVTLPTWLALGALSQSLAYLALGRLAFLPATLYLLYSALDTYAMSVGFKSNTFMTGVHVTKFTSQIPSPSGTFGNKPSNNDIVVLLIGTRSNHPLGILAPGAKTLTDYFTQMERDLETHAEEFGYLGSTAWLNASARDSHNEIMTIAYFRNVDGLHAFAHSDYHRKAWDWWNRTIKEHPHQSIFHEVYAAPKGGSESIYINSHLSGLSSCVSKVEGEERWVQAAVDARKGVLSSSAGRLGQKGAKSYEGPY